MKNTKEYECIIYFHQIGNSSPSATFISIDSLYRDMSTARDWINTLATLTPIIALGYLLAALHWISATIDASGAEVGFFVILVAIAFLGVVGPLLGRESVPIVAGFFLVALSFLHPALWFVLLPVGFAIAGSGIVLADGNGPKGSVTVDRSPER